MKRITKRVKIPTTHTSAEYHKSGIYCIRHIQSNNIYIGSAKDFWTRWRYHFWELNNNKHHSKHLQNAWNKYGADAFEFKILETCLLDELIYLEDIYLASCLCIYNHKEKASSNLGHKYNNEFKQACSKAQKQIVKERREGIRPWHSSSKNYVIIKPDGTIEYIYNLYEYCRVNKLDSSKMVKIAKGIKQWEKGYQCFYLGEEHKALDISLYKKPKDNTGKSKKCIIYSPNKKVKYEVESLAPFCKENNLNRSLMSRVCRGEQSHHKQWTGEYIND